MTAALLLSLTLTSAPLDVVKSVTADHKALSPDKVAGTLEQHIDFEELSRRSLQDQWGKLDKKQQAQFVATLRALLRANWLQKLLGEDRSAQTVYGAVLIDGDDARVETQVDVGGEPLPIVYLLKRRSTGDWKIYDLVTDGASLVDLYQREFKKQIARDGYDGLVRTLKTKVAQLESTQTAKPKPQR